MKILLLTVLACLVSATEEPLPFSGNFSTIYLASQAVSVTGENSQFRMLMREVKFFKNYTLMSMTFYVRKSGKCQLHTVWEDKSQHVVFKKKFVALISLGSYIKRSEPGIVTGTWVLRDANRHFPQIYSHPAPEGGRFRCPSKFYISIHFVSNTTILLEARFTNNLGNKQRLTAALARGTNVTENMWKDYVNLTRFSEIPIENIQNVYEADACPKWER